MIPGFVDLQVNGYRGVDFSAPGLTVEKVHAVSRELHRLGIVAYCPTVITSSMKVYRDNLPILAHAATAHEGAKILGIHLEGPFINPKARGVHPESFIHTPSIELFEQLRQLAQDRISILSLAPEMPGAMELISEVSRNTNTVISLAHHLADRDTIYRAKDTGAKACTHVGNGLPEMLHRHLNPIWPILACDGLSAMIISDGYHLPEDVLRVFIRAKGVDQLIITSDMVHLAGLAPGAYDFAGVAVVLEECGHLHVKDAYQLAGSGCSMFHCMNHLASLEVLDEAQLIQVGYTNPLQLVQENPNGLALPSQARISFDNRRFQLNPS